MADRGCNRCRAVGAIPPDTVTCVTDAKNGKHSTTKPIVMVTH